MGFNIFGTDGLRRKNSDFLLKKNQIYKIFLAIFESIPTKKIFIAYDGRISYLNIAIPIINTAIKCNIEPCFLGILPTAAISLISPPNLGIMITASHNDLSYSGFKIFDQNGQKISIEMEEKISKIFLNKYLYYDNPLFENYNLSCFYRNYEKLYGDFLLKYFFTKKCLKYKIIIDCNHGATSKIIKKFITQSSLNATIINSDINGINVNSSKDILKYPTADYIFKFDGDGDRIQIYNSLGENINITQLMVSIAKKNKLKYISTTYMTSSNVTNYLDNHGIKNLYNKCRR